MKCSRLRHLLHKGFISFPILYKWPFRPRCPGSRPITMDSCYLLMFSSLIALLCWGPFMRALECLQFLPDFQHSMCFLSIQSPSVCMTTLYGRPSMGTGPVNGVFAPFLTSSSALSLPKIPSCPGTHQLNWVVRCQFTTLIFYVKKLKIMNKKNTSELMNIVISHLCLYI